MWAGILDLSYVHGLFKSSSKHLYRMNIPDSMNYQFNKVKPRYIFRIWQLPLFFKDNTWALWFWNL